MLNAITSFFDNHFTSKHTDEKQLNHDQLHLASAALLIELSKADRAIDEEETASLVNILRQRFDLAEDDLAELMTLAQQEADEATSLYQFTSLMNDKFGYQEKVETILGMWEVAYADGRIDRYEEHLIRKVAELLHLSHKDFIKSKHVARDRAGA